MSRPAPFSMLLPLSALVLATACGGGGGEGGGGDGGDDIRRLIVIAAPEYDGVVDSTGFLTFDPRTSDAYTGDLEGSFDPGYRMRQLFAFRLTELPAGAEVVQAYLRLDQTRVEGSPYGKIGNVIVDHVNYMPDPGVDSFDGQTLTRDIGTLSTDGELEIKTLLVTDAVRADLAVPRPWSQYRLRFHLPRVLPVIDLVNDFARFAAAEDLPPDELPALVISYR